MFVINNSFYYLTIFLQAICVIHCLRKGTQTSWIWLIVFVPLVGCIAYIVLEIINRNTVHQLQSGVRNTFYPAGRIRKLEKQLQFSDTFNNRVLLADAYLAAGNTEKAIALYEASLTGAFDENEHVLSQLVIAYFQVQRYEDAIRVAKKVSKTPQFTRSHARVLYTIALYKTGNTNLAEKEFLAMKTKYSGFEARYEYGRFLLQEQRPIEARKILTDMVAEFSYFNSFEKRNNRFWYNSAKAELKKMSAVVN